MARIRPFRGPTHPEPVQSTFTAGNTALWGSDISQTERNSLRRMFVVPMAVVAGGVTVLVAWPFLGVSVGLAVGAVMAAATAKFLWGSK